jgi:hypothetical protein
MTALTSARSEASFKLTRDLKKRMEEYEVNWSAKVRDFLSKELDYLDKTKAEKKASKEVVEGWVTISPMRDGSGVYRLNGKDYRIVIQHQVTVKHRVAFLGKKEVARATTFHTLIKRLKKL